MEEMGRYRISTKNGIDSLTEFRIESLVSETRVCQLIFVEGNLAKKESN